MSASLMHKAVRVPVTAHIIGLIWLTVYSVFDTIYVLNNIQRQLEGVIYFWLKCQMIRKWMKSPEKMW